MKKTSATEWIKKLAKEVNDVQTKVGGKRVEGDTAYEKAAQILLGARRKKNFVWWAANGGSLTIASHLSQDLLNKLDVKSLPLTDASLLTCMANDYGYENVFTTPFRKLMSKGDVLIAISSSGKSKNILNAVEVAKAKGCKIISLSGFNSDNPLWHKKTDVGFYLPNNLYGIVEVGHLILLHGMIESAWLNTRK